MSGETEKQVSGWTVDTLKEHMERHLSGIQSVIDERDRLYRERDDARRVAVDAALAAVKEQTKQNFDASEKAIVKAETAQREYNVRSNEFRGQLDDQAKRLISRLEVEEMVKRIEGKIGRIDEDIRDIREKNSAGGGAAMGSRMVKDERRADRSTMIAVFGSITTFIGLLVVLWKLSVGR